VVVNGGASVEVGYDGEAYLQDLRPDNDITVTLAGPATCHASFKFSPDPGSIPRIGPVTCQ
jgi:outer membrane usher protein